MNFKRIYKNISILGIGQIVMILFAVGKSKIAAELLSVEGIGLIFALASTIGIIGTISNFGLSTLATRDISMFLKKEKNLFLNEISTYKFLSYITGIFGLLLILIFHKQIGVFTFGNNDYNSYILILCLAPFLSQFNSGQFSILQATQNFKILTKSNILSSFLVFLAAFILYYKLGEIGIPIVILLTALLPSILNKRYVDKLNFDTLKLNSKVLFKRLILLIKSGSFISLTYSLPNITIYLITIFLIKEEGLIISGLFACAYTIMSNFNNLLVSSLNPEFLSRISAQQNLLIISELINNQARLVINLISPVIILLIFSSSFLISIFYNDDFILSNNLLTILLLSIIFKSLTWVLNYVYIVMKNESTFFIVELFLSIIIVLFIHVFYSVFDLETIGIAFLGSNILILLFSGIIIFTKYKIIFNINTILNITPHVLILIFLVMLELSILDFDTSYFYPILFIISALISFFYFKKTLRL